jgi:hypothetical protein
MENVLVHGPNGEYLGLRRSPVVIRGYIQSLSSSQKNHAFDDFLTRWERDCGFMSGSLLVYMQGGGKIDQSLALALYVFDFPTYLVEPAFDPTINVPGYSEDGQ